MIVPVAGPHTIPVQVPPAPPVVAPVTQVAPVSRIADRLEQDPGAARGEAGKREATVQQAERTVNDAPEPVSTQSVLLLRQTGAPVSEIAEAYGLSVQAVRRLMHPDLVAEEPEGTAAAGRPDEG